MQYCKKMIIVLICICSFQFLMAQGSYITHTLKQGETLSMLAQQYHTTVGDIMRMNGMHAESKLVYGSKIKIPSTQKQVETIKKAVTATPVKPSGEITHIVTKGETLYSISKKYNISVDQLKTWNHLPDNTAKTGTLLIINEKGAGKFVATQTQNKETIVTNKKTVQPATEIKQGNPVDENANSKSTVEEETKQQTIQTDANNNLSSEQNTAVVPGSGFFASEFKTKERNDQHNISGISKTFKTASGWSDGKYYILANGINPGTIVKITADNGNSVYAKVLWNMDDMNDNNGVDFRISNATAAALHQDASSFNLNVTF